MEEFERHCHDNMSHAVQTEEGLGIEYDDDVVCEVCHSPDGEDNNEMVFCDKCNICVHQVGQRGPDVPPVVHRRSVRSSSSFSWTTPRSETMVTVSSGFTTLTGTKGMQRARLIPGRSLGGQKPAGCG